MNARRLIKPTGFLFETRIILPIVCPIIADHAKSKAPLIIGASGIVGRNFGKHLTDPANWNVIGVSRHLLDRRLLNAPPPRD
jgi:hypothetical protein